VSITPRAAAAVVVPFKKLRRFETLSMLVLQVQGLLTFFSETEFISTPKDESRFTETMSISKPIYKMMNRYFFESGESHLVVFGDSYSVFTDSSKQKVVPYI